MFHSLKTYLTRIKFFLQVALELPIPESESHLFLKDILEQLQAINNETAKSKRNALFFQVGLTITLWAKMEEQVVNLLAMLLRTNDREKVGLIVYSITNTNVLLTIIHDLFAIDPVLVAHQKRWNRISERIRGLKNARNQIAHNYVSLMVPKTPDDPVFTQQAKFDARLESQKMKPLDSDELMALGSKITDIAVDLGELLIVMSDTLTSHNKS